MSKIDEKVDQLKELQQELGTIELNVLGRFTLADAMREGSKVTEQEVGGWGSGDTACALSAAVISAKSRGYLA